MRRFSFQRYQYPYYFNPPFFNDFLACDTSSSNDTLFVDLLAKNIISYPSIGTSSSRQSALILRFARFRQTAFPCFLPATKAARPLRPCCFSFRNTISVRSRDLSRRPFSKRAVISVLDFMTSKTEVTQ